MKTRDYESIGDSYFDETINELTRLGVEAGELALKLVDHHHIIDFFCDAKIPAQGGSAAHFKFNIGTFLSLIFLQEGKNVYLSLPRQSLVFRFMQLYKLYHQCTPGSLMHPIYLEASAEWDQMDTRLSEIEDFNITAALNNGNLDVGQPQSVYMVYDAELLDPMQYDTLMGFPGTKFFASVPMLREDDPTVQKMMAIPKFDSSVSLKDIGDSIRIEFNAEEIGHTKEWIEHQRILFASCGHDDAFQREVMMNREYGLKREEL